MFFNKKMHAQIRNLQADKEALETELKWCKERADKLQERLTRSNRERLKARQQADETFRELRMTGLKFKALFDGRYQPTHFTIGLGQCGKTVKYFTTKTSEGLLWIYQWHTDGSHKEFTYRLSDIDGRIQYDYEMVALEGLEAKQARRKRLFGY